MRSYYDCQYQFLYWYGHSKSEDIGHFVPVGLVRSKLIKKSKKSSTSHAI